MGSSAKRVGLGSRVMEALAVQSLVFFLSWNLFRPKILTAVAVKVWAMGSLGFISGIFCFGP